ncbi:hypothetical protein HPB47_027637 [Ixodes persulcatus]|uniref:Uncharacterized protein n=1 Tax=Ixodes persulcatus TaxID=34615 RepID=A0AC60PVB6_IXOPE|nr:hypothetical protein HPB47_027637 [Ixodes persulcatus]
MRMSAYAQSLRGPEALRYAKKVGRCEDVDPLALAEDELSSDADLQPKVNFADVRDYLVNGTSFATREQFKAFKSMEAHNFLTSGWVQQPRSKVLADRNVVIVGKAVVYHYCVVRVKKPRLAVEMQQLNLPSTAEHQMLTEAD